MTTKLSIAKDATARRAGTLCGNGYHCSEALFIAVGEALLGELDDRTIMMSSGFAGGVGGGHNELCGALSAGVMIIGALYGRTHFEQKDDLCYALSKAYRDYFVQELGSSTCGVLRSENEARGRKSCAVLVEQAALGLLTMLETVNANNNY